LESGKKESRIYLKVSITIIVCVVIAILITSTILYMNFQSILMKHEYETNLEKMESEGKQRSQLSDIALNTLFKIYNDISVTKLLTYNEIEAIDENAAFIQLRHFLATIPNVDSIYVYNMKNDRVYEVSTEGELVRSWNNDYYKKSNFFDTSAVEMIENCTDYQPFIAVPRFYKVNDTYTKCVYSYIMYDSFNKTSKRNVIMLNLESEYLFQQEKAEDPSTISLVLDKNNNIVYSNSDQFKVLDHLDDDFDVNGMMTEKKSGYFIKEINGTKSVVIFTEQDKYGWRYISMIEYSHLLSQVTKMQSVTILISFLIGCIGVLAAFVCSYRVSVPIRDMSTNIRTLQSERRHTESLTKSMKLKEILENGGLDRAGSRKAGSDILSLLGIPFTEDKKLVLLCIYVDDYRLLLESSNAQFISTFKFAAVNILNEILGESADIYCLDLSIEKSLLFVNIDKKASKEFLDMHLKQMQTLVNEYFKVSMSIVLSDSEENPDDLFRLYEQVEEALSRSIFFGKSSIVHYSDMKMNTVQNYEYPENKEKQLMEFLMYGKAKEAEEIYLSMLEETYGYPIVIYNMVISRVVFMINNVVNLIMKNSPTSSFSGSIILSNLLQEVDTMEERNEKFCLLFVQIQKEVENKRNDKLDQVISNINLLIEKEYTNPSFSIEMLADEVGMSAAYICRIYKQYTGNTINETLFNKRMDKARQLLTESSASINDIAEKVGFNGSSYFYRAFKKVNGVTPNEFRRI
jgi:two-component system, response regulator YesN